MNKKWIIGIILIPIIMLGGNYLAGVLYYLSYFVSPKSVNLFTFIEQVYYYHSIPFYQKHLLLAGLIGFGVSIGLPIMAVYFHFKEPAEKLHGDAQWATEPELYQRKLINDIGAGLVLGGKWGKKILTYTGDSFMFLLSPTRGGKGMSVVITNLLNWRDSLVCTDIKLENFAITSKFRKYVLRQKVYLFNPFAEDGKTHRYNPLSYVRDGILAVGDIQTISAFFYPKVVGAKGSENFFNAQARKLFLALALMIRETDGLPFTIGEILRQSSGKGKPLKEYLTSLIEAHPANNPFSDDALTAMYTIMGQAEETLSGTISTFEAPLDNWRSPIFDAATSETDFDFRELRKQRITIYVGITADYLPVATEILNVFFNQLVNLNVKELPLHNPDLKYKCLLLLDEFAALGQVNELAHAISHIAGYGFRVITIIQDIGQIYKIYGTDTGDNYVNNHTVHVVHTVGSRNNKEAEIISKSLGAKTVIATSHQRGAGWFSQSSPSDTESEQRRPLMLPQELQHMSYWKQIVMIGGEHPIKCDKIGYFKEPVFLERLKQVSPTFRAVTRQLEKEEFEAIVAAGEMEIELPLATTDLRPVPKPTKEQVRQFELSKEAYADDDTKETNINVIEEAQKQAQSLYELGDETEF